jgi:hypothetical protein
MQVAQPGKNYDDLAKRLEALMASITAQQALLKHSREEAAILREEIRADRRAHGLEDRAARLDLHPPKPSFETARPQFVRRPEPPAAPLPPMPEVPMAIAPAADAPVPR